MKRVYIAACGTAGPVKIGISRNPAQRVLGFQTPNVVELSFASEPRLDAGKIEQLAHRLLEAASLHGEWFNVSVAEALEVIKEAIREIERPKEPPDPHVVALEHQLEQAVKAAAEQTRERDAARARLTSCRWRRPKQQRAELARLEQATNTALEKMQQRDVAICELARFGVSLARIGELARLSSGSVSQIVRSRRGAPERSRDFQPGASAPALGYEFIACDRMHKPLRLAGALCERRRADQVAPTSSLAGSGPRLSLRPGACHMPRLWIPRARADITCYPGETWFNLWYCDNQHYDKSRGPESGGFVPFLGQHPGAASHDNRAANAVASLYLHVTVERR